MNVFEMVRNGGIFALAALAAGVVGVVLGAVGFAVKGKSAVGIGVVTALIGAAAAGLGMIGTGYGKHRTQEALGMVNPVDAERILPIGYAEAQDASWIGFGASLVPLLLGAAHVMRARSAGAVPVVASLTQPREENPAPIAAASLAFVGIAVLSAGGALVMARAPLPRGPLGLDPHDEDAWSLAHAIDRVKSPEPGPGCSQLHDALERYAAPVKGAGWPREFARQPPGTLDWRAAANTCVDRWVHNADTGAVLSIDTMMESPMVHDTRLRGMVLEKKNQPNAADLQRAFEKEPDPATKVKHGAAEPAPEEAPPKDEAGLSASDIQPVIRAAGPKVKRCYEARLAKKPGLQGKIVVHLVVGPKGDVAEAVEQSDPPFEDAATTQCVLETIRALKFPKAAGKTSINFPFVFRGG